MNERLQLLRDYFPTAIYTGKALVFISEEHRVELTELPSRHFTGSNPASIRVRLYIRNNNGEFTGGHYEDFEIDDIHDLAGEIEKFVQFSVGRNIKEL